jgi:hypothetical protein
MSVQVSNSFNNLTVTNLLVVPVLNVPPVGYTQAGTLYYASPSATLAQGAQGSVYVSSGNGYTKVGQTGAIGVQGYQGQIGPPGYLGNQGSSNSIGYQGTPGNLGPFGGIGPQGVNAVYEGAGFYGYVGYIGNQGPQGNNGLQGAQGSQGVQGLIGDQSSVPQGAQGVQGAQGSGPGAPGIYGYQGAQGLMGYQGYSGQNISSNGPPGYPGRPGSDVASVGVTALANAVGPLVISGLPPNPGSIYSTVNITPSTNSLTLGLNVQRSTYNGIAISTVNGQTDLGGSTDPTVTNAVSNVCTIYRVGNLRTLIIPWFRINCAIDEGNIIANLTPYLYVDFVGGLNAIDVPVLGTPAQTISVGNIIPYQTSMNSLQTLFPGPTAAVLFTGEITDIFGNLVAYVASSTTVAVLLPPGVGHTVAFYAAVNGMGTVNGQWPGGQYTFGQTTFTYMATVGI